MDCNGSGNLHVSTRSTRLNSSLDTHLPSLFWHYLTPSNSLQLTWQNVLYNRESDMPITEDEEPPKESPEEDEDEKYYRQVDYCTDSHLQRFGDIPKRSLKRWENLFWPEKPERLAISEIE